MRLRLAMLALGVLLVSAVAAKADGVTDPTVVVHQSVDPTCSDVPTATCFSENSATDPLELSNFDTLNTFVYDGADPLKTLFVEVNPVLVPGIYTCQSDIFAECEPYAPPADPNALEFEFFDGSLAADTEITAIVSPEPSALLLLSFGLTAVLEIGRASCR